MRSARPGMAYIHFGGITAIIDATGTTDPAVDNAIGGDGTGPRPANVTFQLPGPPLDPDISRTAHRYIQPVGSQVDLEPNRGEWQRDGK